MKLAIRIVATVPDEGSVDTMLAVAQALGQSLKNNGVMIVDELVLEREDD